MDTAQALVGAPVEDVTALPGGGGAGVVHGDDVAVSLRFADGSLAVIAYGSADPVAGKEWIEIQAGSHRVTINDFRSAEADGKTIWKGAAGQGTPSVRRGVPRGHNGWGGYAHRGHAGHDARHHPGRGRDGRSWLSRRWTTRSKYSCSLTPRRAVGPPRTRRMAGSGRLTKLADAAGIRYPGGRVLISAAARGTGPTADAGLRVTGCDISANMLAAPRRTSRERGWIQLDPDWRMLPFATASFDAVLAASVLECVGSQLPYRTNAPGCCGRVASCCARSPTPPTRFAGWNGWPVTRPGCHASGLRRKAGPGSTAI